MPTSRRPRIAAGPRFAKADGAEETVLVESVARPGTGEVRLGGAAGGGVERGDFGLRPHSAE